MQSRPVTSDDWAGWSDGSHDSAYEVMGAHPVGDGTWEFRVWAPNAASVSVVGDWNHWDGAATTMMPSDVGVWTATCAAAAGMRYKFRITAGGATFDKADPFAFHCEEPPHTSSVLWDMNHTWHDGEWMERRGELQALDQPMSVYEVHLGSWDRREPITYRSIASKLVAHVQACGFTHVELLPVMEHPYFGSWGYQTTGYFAPTCRYGSPDDFRYLVDYLHQQGIGVILDWVPSHFPEDAFALAKFDGTHLFEHADKRLGFHPDWKSLIFNYGRSEVRSFLVSSAKFWVDQFHADGIRVDAVASMLYLDYSREAGEWLPNRYGGRENLEAVQFLQQLNGSLYHHHPDIQMIAEESTAWPGVTKPVHHGGLGFGMKWDMGWMHDTLEYLQHEPIHRAHHHREITFRSNWAYTENYTLPISHDEVVHGKGSLVGKMPGDDWQRHANLRLLLGWQWAQPGKKLLFMGAEVAQSTEWHHESDVPRHSDDPRRSPHAEETTRWVAALNELYRSHAALHAGDCDHRGFEWLVGNDHHASVCVFLRHDPRGAAPPVLVVANFTPVVRDGYAIGVPTGGEWREICSSDDIAFGGSGVTDGMHTAWDDPVHGQPSRLVLRLPPLAITFLTPM
ncbi:MAG TPA: 1,4-alpha-glucan branching protein GlgB [Ilumatobacter sp.]|nr:1,4-alpha-glucan branching protein GlgB [Ilumatobacter sp.]